MALVQLDYTRSDIWSTEVMIGCYTQLQAPFDLWLWGHVMKEIYIGAELCKDQTLSRAMLRCSLPWVIFISSQYLKGQWAQFIDATGVPLQTCSLQDSNAHEMTIRPCDHHFHPPKRATGRGLIQYVLILVVIKLWQPLTTSIIFQNQQDCRVF